MQASRCNWELAQLTLCYQTKEENVPGNGGVSKSACQFTAVTGSLYRIEQKPEPFFSKYPAKQKNLVCFLLL